MRSWIKRLAVPIAAVALFAFAPAAKAVIVTYNVTSGFTSFTSGELTIAFAGQTTFSVNPPPPTAIDLGRFTVTATDTNLNGNVDLGASSFSIPFSLTVNQTAPVAGNQVLTSTNINGTINYTAGIVGGGLTLDLSPNSWAIDGVTYTLVNDPMGINLPSNITVGATATATSDVRALVDAAPLPGVAWAGFSLFGLLGGKRLMKRRTA